MEFMIPRYNRLLIHYYNENYKSQFAYTHGFVSRMVQHQCEHLEGKTLIDWRINHGSMTMNQSVVKYFPKASAVLDDYANTLKTVLKEFP
jgi:peptide deformylase